MKPISTFAILSSLALSSHALAANLEISTARTDSGFSVSFKKDPFLATSRITEDGNTDYARVEKLHKALEAKGFFVEKIDEELDTSTFHYGLDKVKKVVEFDRLSPNAQFLDRWAKIVDDLSQYQREHNFSLDHYAASKYDEYPALIVSKAQGELDSALVNDALKGRFASCFLRSIDGLKIPETLQKVANVKCGNEEVQNFFAQEIPQWHFELSSKTFGQTAPEEPGVALHFGVMAEDLCEPASNPAFPSEIVQADYHAAGWVSQKSYPNTAEYLKECRRHVLTKIVGKLPGAIRKAALDSSKQEGLSPYAKNFLAALVKESKLENSASSKAARELAFLEAVKEVATAPDMTSLAVAYQKAVDFSSKKLRAALESYSGKAEDFPQVVDRYFDNAKNATGSKTAFEKAFLQADDEKQALVKEQFVRLLTGKCKAGAKVDEACITASLQKVNKYSVTISSPDHAPLAQGFGLAAWTK